MDKIKSAMIAIAFAIVMAGAFAIVMQSVVSSDDIDATTSTHGNDEEYDFVVDEIEYKIVSDSTVSVYGVTDTFSASAIVLDKVSYGVVEYTIISVGDNAFKGKESITSVVLGAGVESIGTYSFVECINMVSIDIPSTLKSIKSHAFNNCRSLTSVTLPDNSDFKAIEDYTFFYCQSLKEIKLNSNIVTIGSNAFAYCFLCEGTLNIPSSVKEIGDYAFYQCSSLTGVVFNEGLEKIGNYAFSSNKEYPMALKGDLTIPSTVTCIGSHAFYNAMDFDGNFTIVGGSVPMEIKDYAFGNCYYLGKTNDGLTIPDNVTSIGDGAFSICFSIEGTLKIGSGVKTIGDYAFLLTVGFDKLELGNAVETIGSFAFASTSDYSMSLSGELIIPASVKSIGARAFQGDTGFTSLTFKGNNIVSIDEHAFYSCSGLAGVLSIPDSVKTIGARAFDSCSKLTSLKLPNNTNFTEIAEGVFYNCSGLKGELSIGGKITTIGAYAFCGASSFESIKIDGVKKIGASAFEGCKSVKTLYISSSSTIDSMDSFKGWSFFESDGKTQITEPSKLVGSKFSGTMSKMVLDNGSKPGFEISLSVLYIIIIAVIVILALAIFFLYRRHNANKKGEA